MSENRRSDAELLAAAIRRHGGQLQTLARRLGVDPSAVSAYQRKLPRLVRLVFELEEQIADGKTPSLSGAVDSQDSVRRLRYYAPPHIPVTEDDPMLNEWNKGARDLWKALKHYGPDSKEWQTLQAMIAMLAAAADDKPTRPRRKMTLHKESA